jgi:hypothetical protein
MSHGEHDPDGPITLPRFGADAFYDAGDKGCGDGPLDDIALLIRKMQGGQTLEIHATERDYGRAFGRGSTTRRPRQGGRGNG